MNKLTAIIAVVSALVFAGVWFGPLGIGAIGVLMTVLSIGFLVVVAGEVIVRLGDRTRRPKR